MKNKKKNIILEEMFKPRIPMIMVIIMLMVWIYLVINNYYKFNQINFSILEQYFSLDEYGKMLGLENYIVLLKNVVVMFYGFIIFFSIYSLGNKVIDLFDFKEISFTEKILFSLSVGFLLILNLFFILGIFGFLYKSLLVGVTLIFCFVGLYDIFVKDKNEIFNRLKIKFFGIEKIWLLITLFLSIIILTLGINKKKVRLGIVHTNENGKLIISPKTFDSAAYYVIKNIKGIRDVNIETFIDVDGIEITVDAVVLTDINIPELTTEVQTTLKNYIETTTGIMVKLVHFHVKDISPQTQSMPRVR